ncbi:hypothetical protein KIPB_006657, partial [Kipferlia bialata]
REAQRQEGGDAPPDEEGYYGGSDDSFESIGHDEWTPLAEADADVEREDEMPVKGGTMILKDGTTVRVSKRSGAKKGIVRDRSARGGSVSDNYVRMEKKGGASAITRRRAMNSSKKYKKGSSRRDGFRELLNKRRTRLNAVPCELALARPVEVQTPLIAPPVFTRMPLAEEEEGEGEGEGEAPPQEEREREREVPPPKEKDEWALTDDEVSSPPPPVQKKRAKEREREEVVESGALGMVSALLKGLGLAATQNTKCALRDTFSYCDIEPVFVPLDPYDTLPYLAGLGTTYRSAGYVLVVVDEYLVAQGLAERLNLLASNKGIPIGALSLPPLAMCNHHGVMPGLLNSRASYEAQPFGNPYVSLGLELVASSRLQYVICDTAWAMSPAFLKFINACADGCIMSITFINACADGCIMPVQSSSDTACLPARILSHVVVLGGHVASSPNAGEDGGDSGMVLKPKYRAALSALCAQDGVADACTLSLAQPWVAGHATHTHSMDIPLSFSQDDRGLCDAVKRSQKRQRLVVTDDHPRSVSSTTNLLKATAGMGALMMYPRVGSLKDQRARRDRDRPGVTVLSTESASLWQCGKADETTKAKSKARKGVGIFQAHMPVSLSTLVPPLVSTDRDTDYGIHCSQRDRLNAVCRVVASHIPAAGLAHALRSLRPGDVRRKESDRQSREAQRVRERQRGMGLDVSGDTPTSTTNSSLFLVDVDEMVDGVYPGARFGSKGENVDGAARDRVMSAIVELTPLVSIADVVQARWELQLSASRMDALSSQYPILGHAAHCEIDRRGTLSLVDLCTLSNTAPRQCFDELTRVSKDVGFGIVGSGLGLVLSIEHTVETMDIVKRHVSGLVSKLKEATAIQTALASGSATSLNTLVSCVHEYTGPAIDDTLFSQVDPVAADEAYKALVVPELSVMDSLCSPSVVVGAVSGVLAGRRTGIKLKRGQHPGELYIHCLDALLEGGTGDGIAAQHEMDVLCSVLGLEVEEEEGSEDVAPEGVEQDPYALD